MGLCKSIATEAQSHREMRFLGILRSEIYAFTQLLLEFIACICESAFIFCYIGSYTEFE